MKEKASKTNVKKGFDTPENLVVTVSGGRSSALMARHIQTSPKYATYKKIFVFANTGQERPETIQFLKDIVQFWGIDLYLIEGVYSTVLGVGVSYRIVSFDTINMNSSPFAQMIAHKNKGKFNGLPFSEAPYCSESLKRLPCKKLSDDVFGINNYKIAIGYRLEDMPKRITWAEVKSDPQRIFPLLTDFNRPYGQRELNEWWSLQPFRLNLHSALGNCELCWKKSDATLIKAIQRGARSIQWWQNMELQYSNTSFRGNKSVNDFVKQAKQPYTIEIDFEEPDGCICSF